MEEALLRHDAVVGVAVVGRPDPEWGEAMVAFIVAADAANAPTTEELDQLCLDHIARFPITRPGRLAGRRRSPCSGRARAQIDGRGEMPMTIAAPSTADQGDDRSLDGDGKLTLRDRSNELIISGGMNICLHDVKEALP